jgi:hypothetical protein
MKRAMSYYKKKKTVKGYKPPSDNSNRSTGDNRNLQSIYNNEPAPDNLRVSQNIFGSNNFKHVEVLDDHMY